MHKLCACAYCSPPACIFNTNCCLKSTLPRHCASCILPHKGYDDEWKCYSRCLSGFYRKNLTNQFESPLWRQVKRARAKAASVLDLSTAEPLDRCSRAARNGKLPKISTSAEIVVEKAHECRAGRLRLLAKTQDCDCHRMAQLLLQRKLCDKCRCNPYDNLPHVPLTFYPPKKTCYDIYGNTCDDEYAKKLLEYVSRETKQSLTAKQMLNKTFLTNLNKLYADVGGGRFACVGDKRHSIIDREEEFNGFFGEENTERYKSYKRFTQQSKRRSLVSAAVGSDTLLNERFSQRHSTSSRSNSFGIPFHYPTDMPIDRRKYMRVDADTIKKYLAFGQRRRRNSFTSRASR